MDEAIEILGMLAFVVLFFTLLSGVLMFMRRVKWLEFQWHMRFGIAAFILSSLHAIMALMNY